MRSIAIFLISAALSAPLFATGENVCCPPAPPAPPPPVAITLRGEATLEIPPDEAVLEFELAWEAPDLTEARRAHNEQSQKVMVLLRAAEAGDDDIRTSLSITRNVKIEGKIRTRTITSHHVQTDYVVTLHRLDKLDKLLDGLIEAKVDNFTGVHFKIRHPEDRLKKLRIEALADARTQAEATAKQMGVRLGRMTGLSGPAGAGTRDRNPGISGASGLENQYIIGGLIVSNGSYGDIGKYQGESGISAFDFKPTQVQDNPSATTPVEGEESVFSRPGTLRMKVEVFVTYELDDYGKLPRPAPEPSSVPPAMPKSTVKQR
jgi:hypothetical protein